MMSNNTFGKTLKINIIFTYSAQLVSMIISIIFTLIIPKILGVEGFGYWQLLVLYINYLGIFYFGLNDGIYLRIGGIQKDDLCKYKIREQSNLFFLIHIVFTLILMFITILFVKNQDRKFILILTLFLLPFFNIKGLLDQVFQAINMLKVHSISIILEKLLVLVSIIGLFLLGYTNYKIYTLLYVLSAVVSAIYVWTMSFNIVKKNNIGIKELIYESKLNIKIGIPLMLSSFASLLILSMTKQIMDFRWGISSFSIVALSISMVSLFLVFINKSGVVLFPSLRTISDTKQKVWYENVKEILNIFLPFAFFGYIPLKFVIDFWLPEYTDSITYISILLPLVLFEGKMGILGTTYLKVLRMEKWLFFINAISLLMNLVLGLIAAYYFNNVLILLSGLVLSLAFRSFISDYILNKYYRIKFLFSDIYIVLITVVFVGTHFLTNEYISFMTYFSLIILYTYANRKKIIKSYNCIKLINNEKYEEELKNV